MKTVNTVTDCKESFKLSLLGESCLHTIYGPGIFWILWVIPRQNSYWQLPVDSDVLKNNINSLLDFGGDLKHALKRPKLKPKISKTLKQRQRVRLKKQPLILKKPTLRLKKPKMLLKKLKILLKMQMQYYWKPKRIIQEL